MTTFGPIVSHSERDMQDIMNCFSTACEAFGLTISIKKTKVMFTPAPGAPYIESNIYVRERRLDVVDTFVYLGSIVSQRWLLGCRDTSSHSEGQHGNWNTRKAAVV